MGWERTIWAAFACKAATLQSLGFRLNLLPHRNAHRLLFSICSFNSTNIYGVSTIGQALFQALGTKQ